jgi:hypothetical protein
MSGGGDKEMNSTAQLSKQLSLKQGVCPQPCIPPQDYKSRTVYRNSTKNQLTKSTEPPPLGIANMVLHEREQVLKIPFGGLWSNSPVKRDKSAGRAS